MSSTKEKDFTFGFVNGVYLMEVSILCCQNEFTIATVFGLHIHALMLLDVWIHGTINNYEVSSAQKIKLL